MPTLENKLARRSFVVTAEMPVIDGGGRGDVLRHLEPMAPYVDAFNATDNPSAHAHCSPLAVSIALVRRAPNRSCSSPAVTATGSRWRPS